MPSVAEPLPSVAESLHSIAESLRDATRALSETSDSPRLDAELLLCKVTGLSRTALRVRAEDTLDAHRRAALSDLITRRVRGTPVAYLTESREFWSLGLRVTPDVLVPRPETEVLVEQVLARVPEASAGSLLDLGTGSGAVALAVASERPWLHVTGTDLCPRALAVAAHNARTLGLPQVEWLTGSWFTPVAGRRFDVIVSNPPYVAAGDAALTALAAEPRLALTPGPTGFEALTAIVAAAAAHLHPAGWLLLEHGSDQSGPLAHLLERHGFSQVRTIADYSGRSRVTLGTYHAIPNTLRAV